jgi:hypothetical protein
VITAGKPQPDGALSDRIAVPDHVSAWERSPAH